MVETALMLLLFLTVLFGIIGFSQWIRAYHFAAHAAREGSRYAMVRGEDSGHPTSVTDVTTYLQRQFVGIGADNFTVTMPGWPAGGMKAGDIVTVTVQYVSDPLVPFMPSSSITIQSSSKMMVAQ